MGVQEPVRSRQLLTSYVPISCQVPIAISCDSMIVTIALTPVEPLFPAHERVRVLAKLLANSGVALQKLLQCRVILNELLVVDQRRIFAQLLRDFRMAIHKPIHGRKLLAGYVPIPVPIATVGVFPPFIA